MGFPPPELQARFTLSNGRSAFTDFFWREHRHIGEFDGVGKYRDPELLRGRTAEEVLLAEKDREDELRRQVSRFSRWRVPALDQPRLLFDILKRMAFRARIGSWGEAGFRPARAGRRSQEPSAWTCS